MIGGRKWIVGTGAAITLVFIGALALIYFRRPTQADFARVLLEVQALNLPVGGHPNVSVQALNSFPSSILNSFPTARMDVAVRPDGRTVLLIKTSIGWKGNYDGYVYASAPLTAAEVTSDYYGRDEILIPELEGIVVRKKYYASFFEVFFDLN